MNQWRSDSELSQEKLGLLEICEGHHVGKQILSRAGKDRLSFRCCGIRLDHHWTQVAMEARQAGFPTDKPQDIIITDVLE